MSALLYGPRRVVCVDQFPLDALAAMRAAGHHVDDWTAPSVEQALRAADILLVAAPAGPSQQFYVGAAWALHKPVLALVTEAGRWPYGGAVAAHAVDVGDLLELLRRWDPVARAFVDPPGAVVRYRHRVTGEVRELVPRKWAINPTIELLSEGGKLERFWPGHGIEEWERVGEGGTR